MATRRRINKLSKARDSKKVPRLVEYFCVVSCLNEDLNNVDDDFDSLDHVNNDNDHGKAVSPRKRHDDDTPLSSSFRPRITSRYPLKDHDENPLLEESVTAFCFPSGDVTPVVQGRLSVDGEDQESDHDSSHQSGSDNHNHSNRSDNGSNHHKNSNSNTDNNYCSHNELRMPKVHYFVTTGETGQSMYGTCLTLWERAEFSSRSHYYYLPKCLVILSMYPYLVAFREYLTQLHRLSKTKPQRKNYSNNSISVQAMTLPIERYITNFCSEIPAPPSGAFQVETTILDSVISIWSPPHNLPIQWVSLPFSHLFQCLDVENVLKLWTALALERQVLLTSTQLSLLTTCCEILLSLLFPMKWTNAYIPVLPHFLVPILSAPMPFLCGIDKQYLAHTLEDLSSECIVVDLDKNQLSLGTKTPPLPSLPKHTFQTLLQKLHTNASPVYREVRSLRKADNTSEFGFHLSPEIKFTSDAMWESRLCLFDEAFMLTFTPEERRKNYLNGDDGSGAFNYLLEERRGDAPAVEEGERDTLNELVRLMTRNEKQQNHMVRVQSQWDAVQEAFLETFCFLLQRYRKFLVFPTKKGIVSSATCSSTTAEMNSKSVEGGGGGGGTYGGAGFRSLEFLAGQRGDVKDFLEELVGTQMFDDFVTKRLYGSGEADIAFFDSAVDRYVKNQSLMANVSATLSGSSTSGTFDGGGPGRRIRNFLVGAGSGNGNSTLGNLIAEREPPLLQSARVKRKLKTIVPPEPCGADLEDKCVKNAMVMQMVSKLPREGDDKKEEEQYSVVGESTYGFMGIHTNSSDETSIPSVSGSSSNSASTVVNGRVYYHYPTFPERLDPTLFGTPRPMSSAVMVEYDRQRENAGKFRRMVTVEEAENATALNFRRNPTIIGQSIPAEKPATSEVTTFTVFFMAFTAIMGNDLVTVDNDFLDQLDNISILSTYNRPDKQRDVESAKIACLVDEIVMDADLPQTPTKDKRSHSRITPQKSPPRNRFNDKLSTLKIMEARETAKAELGIAFEMLKMMKERGLRADPEAYQCLIDACGRCGDTDRATQLLSRMHEDGIVADGVVYSSLVAAFSTENAWKRVTGEVQEELPEWANGASMDMDWNTLKVQKRSYIDIVKEKLGASDDSIIGDAHPAGLKNTFNRIVSRNKTNQLGKKEINPQNVYTEQFVTDHVLHQILLGENLLEIVYPDIAIDTDNEFCPRCHFYLSDDDVVAGWTAGNSQEYKTQCPNCLTNFVPHFCVQSTLPSFVGSRGPASPLFCERLSPWVLKKELRSVISGGVENLLNPDWREKEVKNAVLWWNLILSFMRYRFPFTFLLQGSFSSSLITPTPDSDQPLSP